MRNLILNLIFILLPLNANALTTEDLKSHSPSNLLVSFKLACDKSGSYEKIASLHSKRIETLLIGYPDHERIKKVYCTSIEKIFNEIGNDAKGAIYEIRIPTGTQKRPTLCITPKASIQKCKFSFDVIIENGTLKKDEL